jgi:hypothetical protein
MLKRAFRKFYESLCSRGVSCSWRRSLLSNTGGTVRGIVSEELQSGYLSLIRIHVDFALKYGKFTQFG